MTDPNFSQVQLLVGADTSITDESNAARTLTSVGSAAVSSTQSKFGGQSVRFPDPQGISHSSYYYAADSADVELGSDPFTIECFFYLDQLTTTTNDSQMLVAKDDDIIAQRSWYFAYDGTNGGPHQLEFFACDTANNSGNSIFLQGGTISATTWHHAVVDFDGTTYRMYLDGTMVDSDTFALGAIANATSRLSIGGQDRGGGAGRTLKLGYIDEVRLTVGTARYASDSGYTVPTEAFPRTGPPPVEFEDTITEDLNLFSLAGEFTNDILWQNEADSFTVGVDALSVDRRLNPVVADTVRNFAFLDVSKGYTATETDTINITPTLLGVRGVFLAESIGIAQAQVVSNYFGKTLADSAELTDLISRAFTGTIAETVNASELLDVVRAAVIVEQLGITETVVGSALYGKTLADGLALADSLANFFNIDVADALTMAAATVENMIRSTSLAEQVDITPTITPTLIMSVTADESVEITPTQAINFLYSDTLDEGIEIVGGMFDPSGDLVTWTMNTRTAAVSTYDNFDFRSFAKLGDKYVAAAPDGLYELYGGTDNGSDIIASLRGGFLQFNGTRHTRLKAAYMAVRGEGDFVLRIEDGEGRTYNYAVSTRNTRSTKVHMGKGQRARYFAYELTSAGQDFELDTLEFVPVVMRRRV